jgi:hypothetical protein
MLPTSARLTALRRARNLTVRTHSVLGSASQSCELAPARDTVRGLFLALEDFWFGREAFSSGAPHERFSAAEFDAPWRSKSTVQPAIILASRTYHTAVTLWVVVQSPSEPREHRSPAAAHRGAGSCVRGRRRKRTSPSWGASAQVSAVRNMPSHAPCPCQGICIACSLLLALPRCHLRVGGMFSRCHQQPILADGALLIVPFAFNHYTYL